MHDGLQPVSLLQEADSRDPDDTAGPLLTAEKPIAALPVQTPREATPPAWPGHGGRRGAQPAGLTEPTGLTEATEPGGERAPAGPDVPAPAAPVVASAPKPAQPDEPARAVPAEDLTDEQLLRPRRAAPTRGWRRVVFHASFGLVNPGQSPAELRYQALVARAQAPMTGCRRIAVVSAKGGVGKTSTTLGLGATAASVRGDRVVAVDANPDLGTLGERVRRDNQATVRDLLRAAGRLERYPDVRAFTSQTPARLEVLAADRDPALSEAFDEADYRQACDLLGRFYNLLVTDCGTGLLHSAMAGVLGVADQIVLVAAPAVDAARSAAATLDWLDAHSRSDLVARRRRGRVRGTPRRRRRRRPGRGALRRAVPQRAAGPLRPAPGRGRAVRPRRPASRDPAGLRRAGRCGRRRLHRRDRPAVKFLLDAVGTVTSLALLVLGVRWTASTRGCALRVRPTRTVIGLTDHLARAAAPAVELAIHPNPGGTA